MIEIKTKRLKIVCPGCDELPFILDNMPEFEKAMNAKYDAEPIEGIFKEIVKEQCVKMKEDAKNYEWHSFWMIICGDVIVGSIDFKDVPKDGTVEIGYGLGTRYCHNGYMTESVGAFCEYAKSRGVKVITAETLNDNAASQNVLKRNGFKFVSQGETTWWNKIL